ncbi:MAG: pyridoxal phosphate-dependent aminotransferase [Candidatus Brocadiae bacterium]|nr:pyridoxal phosphate-dependent aminotransferase [Candidatus Brocadiia bacterium]
MFADRVKNITASGIRKVFDLAAKMQNPVNFSIGQPDFDVPEPVKEAAIQAIQQGLNKYTMTQGISILREKVKEELQKTKNITPEGLMITSGTSGALLLAMMVLVNPGDEVLLPDPYFVMYKHLLSLAGGIPQYYSLYPDFEVNVKELEEKITEKTKIIILNSPSNPTGTVLSKEKLVEIAGIAKKHNLIVISDEIYEAFIYEGKHHSIASYYPKTIILSGFSKTYGMPGWRMGYAAGPYEIIEKMSTLQQFSFVCAPTPAQYACVKAFDVDLTPYIQRYKAKRDKIYQGLVDLGFKVIKPKGSFYIFPEAPWGTGQTFCEAAISQEVLVIPGNAFSSRDTHFRISFTTKEEDIDRGLSLLSKVLHPSPKQ